MNRIGCGWVLLVFWLFVALIVWGAYSLVRPAHGARLHPEAKLTRCFVYLPAMRDAKLRRWCLQQSKRLP